DTLSVDELLARLERVETEIVSLTWDAALDIAGVPDARDEMEILSATWDEAFDNAGIPE
ncbi:unnamed protein product, partial [Prorocentrum cordatum]